MRKITQSDDIEIEFVYDAQGNRLMKVEKGINYLGAVYTYYVYDAAGNLMSTYERTQDANHILSTETYTWVDDNLYLSERGIYGSNRIGMKNENRKLTKREFTIDDAYTSFYPTILSEQSQTDYPANFEKEKRKVGEKFYELSNHLNNVLEVITDRKIPNALQTGYEADIVSYSDYYPFGMVMPGRNGMSADYRFTFQGQEKDDEIKGDNNSINYKYRMHDPRLGRFFAVDPLAPKYPHNSPYAFSENRVLDGVELEGLEWDPVIENGKIVNFNWVGVRQQEDGTYYAPAGTVPSGTTTDGSNITVTSYFLESGVAGGSVYENGTRYATTQSFPGNDYYTVSSYAFGYGERSTVAPDLIVNWNTSLSAKSMVYDSHILAGRIASVYETSGRIQQLQYPQTGICYSETFDMFLWLLAPEMSAPSLGVRSTVTKIIPNSIKTSYTRFTINRSVLYRVTIPEGLISRGSHRYFANKQFYNSVYSNSYRAWMQTGKGQLKNPYGYVWHHVINTQEMMLIPKTVHNNPALQWFLHPNGIGGYKSTYNI